MSPNSITVDEKSKGKEITDDKPKSQQTVYRKPTITYSAILYFSSVHLFGLYGLYLSFTTAKLATIAFDFLLFMAAEIGITAGVHRLWSHRSYKAKMPLQIILMLFNTLAYQNTAIYWVRDHRTHHKYCDTDGDPHNASRGFFYSHIGWVFKTKSEEVIKCGKTIDMTDVYNNPVLLFQKKYAILLFSTVCFILPTVIPVYFWDETYTNAWCLNMLRYAANMNATFFINSASHMWGYRPYDKSILPSQNLFVSCVALGEGFHNFHHVFPWDYQAAELGNKSLNITTWFIDFFAWIGWAYDLKKAPEDMVKQREIRSGDGTNLWGWNDKDMKDEYKKSTTILYPDCKNE